MEHPSRYDKIILLAVMKLLYKLPFLSVLPHWVLSFVAAPLASLARSYIKYHMASFKSKQAGAKLKDMIANKEDIDEIKKQFYKHTDL